MALAILAILGGFGLLVWSADRFIDGAAAVSKHLGMPSLLIGVVVIGFGTSAPEMVVSAIAALDGSPNLALGNAYGSNIANVGLILGVTALIAPITVQSKIIRKEIPLLVLISLGSLLQLWDGSLSRFDSVVLILCLFGLLGWSVYSALKTKGDQLESDMSDELEDNPMGLGLAVFWLFTGIVLLVVSSRVSVWGATTIAQAFGVSDLVIGLTIVALGTSLPELAASVIAARKGEHDLALGNVIGSNMFNLLGVVGIASN